MFHGQSPRAVPAILVILALGLGLGCAKAKDASPATGSYGSGGQGQGQASGAAAPSQAGKRQAQITVQALAAVAGKLVVDRNAAGVVTASVTSQVAALTAGIVLAVPKKAGDWVAPGDLVVSLDESQLRIALANAQAAVDTAKVNLQTVQDSTGQNNQKLSLQVQSAQATRDGAKKFYDSQKALFDLGGISASTLDTAGAQLASAEAALETAKIALDQNQRGIATTASQNVDALKLAVQTAQNNLRQAELNLRNASIRAPFGGQISAVNVSPGMYVGLNTAAFVLVSQERQVNFSISPQDAMALPAGAPLVFSFSGAKLPLTVRQAPSAPVGGVVPMVAGGPGLAKLSYGIVGDVSYKVSLASGILVPMSSIDTTDNRNYVYVVRDGKVAVAEIQVIAESGAVAAVSGVEPGAMVVVSPPPGLLAGASVQVIPAQGISLGAGAPSGQGEAPSGGSPGGGTRRTGQWTGQRSGSGASSGSASGSTGQGSGGAVKP